MGSWPVRLANLECMASGEFAMLRDDLTYTTDADQLTRLRTAERPTGLLFTNDQCSLIYMNGCELSTSECCIHHAFGEESMAAPSTYGAVHGL